MLTNDVKQTIQSAYRQFLDNRGLKARQGQKQMIADIANTLANISTDDEGKRVQDDTPHICVVEAGTGTGKTVAYLLAAIPVAQAHQKKLIVSTATVALQEQIVLKDLPEIKRQTDLSFNYILAKGRGRYLCLSKLDRLLQNADLQLDITQTLSDSDPVSIDEQALTIYQSMVDALAAGQWDGDRDSWATELSPDIWSAVTTNHRECTGRRCSNVSSCSFFKAREAIDRYDCIVANHDLVLADLALGGGAILPPPEDSIYIFDEGHHLADKALNHFSYHTRLAATSKWLDQSHKTLSSLLGDISGAGQVDHYAEQLPSILLAAKKELEVLYPLCQQLMESQLLDDNERRFANDQRRYRFENGIPSDAVIAIAKTLTTEFERIARLLGFISTEIQSAMEDAFCKVPKVDLETWFPVVGNWQARADANLSLWRSYANAVDQSTSIPLARWITLVEFAGVVDFEVCSSPILAANTLQYQLWENCYGAVVTSATLTALGKYDRFRMRTGTSDKQHYSVMPSPFDFQQAQLCIPEFSVEANNASAHTDNLIEHLPSLLKTHQGNLVLFSSRKQMEEVYYQLPSSLRDSILLQGDLSKQTMISDHKKAIDAGDTSTLFGLASFAEGVDLPGQYCSHVIIAKLPFAVPDDPVEAALAEWIEQRGGNAFMQIAVPDAAMKLVQACGRLLRTETDSGMITIMDKRLISKRYGKMLLNCLPGYRIV